MRTALCYFTLVEMLVVTAIIAILAAMLSPSLQKSLTAARTVGCTNNHRNLAVCALQYGDDFDGHAAPPLCLPGKTISDNDEPHTPWCWYIIYGEKYAGRSGEVTTTTVNHPRIGGTWDLFRCPADTVRRSSRAYAGVRSYGLAATWVLFYSADFRPDGRLITFNRCRIPGRTYLLMDSNPEFCHGSSTREPYAGEGGNSFLNKHVDEHNPGKNWVGTYHNDGGNFAYADGSVRLRMVWKHRFDVLARMCSQYYWLDAAFGQGGKYTKTGTIDEF